MPRIFDNIDQHLVSALRDTLGVSFRGDFCVGYFNLRGWKQIASLVEQWSGGEGNCCRLLVGMQRTPQEDLQAALSIGESNASIDNQTALRLKKRLAQEFREQLTIGIPTSEDEAGLQCLAAQRRVSGYRCPTTSPKDSPTSQSAQDGTGLRPRSTRCLPRPGVRSSRAASATPRCARLADGEVRSINDMITYSLDIRQFAQDVIGYGEGPDLPRALWKAILEVTVLDPTCGSGAYLFAALNILEPLYDACLDRMEAFRADLARSGETHRPEKYRDFDKVLMRVAQHPNHGCFVPKSIVVNNLYGVDIMEEAVEICKLRLFLKLVAQIGRVEDIEPLPDIDFNIRAGNTLVGFATREEVKRALTTEQKQHGAQAKLLFGEDDARLKRIEEQAQDFDRLFRHFQLPQTEFGGEVTPADKQALRSRLAALAAELDLALAAHYGVDPENKTAYANWLASHQPFHWFVEFYTQRYVPAHFALVDGSLPKLSAELEHSIIDKLSAQKVRLSSFYARPSTHRVYYSRKVGYFLQVLDFEPRVLDGQGARRPPSEFKQIEFRSEEHARIALSCLNANLFYWFVTVFSDCRHVNKREVDAFPVDIEGLASSAHGGQLVDLARNLTVDLERNSEERKMSFRHDTLTVQCIFPKRSKPIIDAIDRVLAEHYGFTAEELDFIINYDIKYRMGREAGTDDE